MAIDVRVVREISLTYANGFERLCFDGFKLFPSPADNSLAESRSRKFFLDLELPLRYHLV